MAAIRGFTWGASLVTAQPIYAGTQDGDTVVMIVFRNAAANPGTLSPAFDSQVHYVNAVSPGCRVAWTTWNTGDATSYSALNANLGYIFITFEGAVTFGTIQTTTGAVSGDMSIPALTFTDTDGSSRALVAMLHRDASAIATPDGMSQLVEFSPAANAAMSVALTDHTTGWAGDPVVEVTDAAGVSVWRTIVMEVLGANLPQTVQLGHITQASTLSPVAVEIAGYLGAVLADGPSAFYRLGDATGTTAADSSGNGRTATHSESVTPTTSPLVNDSTPATPYNNSLVTTRAYEAWMSSLSQITLEVWIVPTGVTTSRMVLGRSNLGANADGNQQAYLMLLDNRWEFMVRAGGVTSWLTETTGTAVVGKLQHIVGTYDGTDMRLYIDSRQVLTTAKTGTLSPGGTLNLTIGGRDGSGFRSLATLDEAAIYPTGLSAARVKAHYLAGRAESAYAAEVLADAPLLYLPLNDPAYGFHDMSGYSRWILEEIGSGSLSRRQPALGAGLGLSLGFNDAQGLRTADTSAAWMQQANLTAECWYSTDTVTGDDAIIGRHDWLQGLQTDAYAWYIIRRSTGLYGLIVRSTGANAEFGVASGMVSIDEKMHLALSYDGTTARLYKNGTQIASQAIAGSANVVCSRSIYIGREQRAFGYVDGEISDVAFYPTALSAARIAAHSAVGEPPVATPITVELGHITQTSTLSPLKRQYLVARNLYPHPSFETAESWVAIVGSNDPVTSTEQAFVGTKSLKATRGAGTATTIGRHSLHLGGILEGAGTYTLSYRLYAPTAVSDPRARISGAGATSYAGGPLVLGWPTAMSKDQWVERTIRFVWDGVGAVLFDLLDQTITAGAYLYLDAVILTKGADYISFLDGDTPDTAEVEYLWDGVPHESKSRMLTTAEPSTIQLGHITQASTLSPVTPQVASIVELGHITTAATLSPMTVQVGALTVQLGHLAETTALSPVTVQIAPTTVQLGHLTETSTLSPVAVVVTITAIYLDSFTRADSATVPGAPDAGGPYTVRAGTWGISAGALYTSASTAESQLTFPGAVDLDLEARLKVVGGNVGIMFRWTDANNFWLLTLGGSSAGVGLHRRVAGSYQQHAAHGRLPVADDVYRLVAIGRSIRVSRNGRLILTAEDQWIASATDVVGYRFNSDTVGRLDDAILRTPVDAILSGDVEDAISAAAEIPHDGFLYKGRDTKLADQGAVA